MKTVRIGTRGSLLALTQTGSVIRKIRRLFPHLQIQTIVIRTTGDQNQSQALAQIGSKGLFIKEIEEALLAKSIDGAVHSLKDMPTEIPKGLAIGAVLKREKASDCLVSFKYRALKNLPKGSRVGTSSLRRQAQILHARPDLSIENLRGNLDTRARKLKGGLFDAIVVAKAGLERLRNRLALDRMKVCEIPHPVMLPACGQGALVVEMRADDSFMAEILARLNDRKSYTCAQSEREFLKTLEGGCQVPVGVYAEIKRSRIHLEGLIASIDGKKAIRKKISGARASAKELGRTLADQMLAEGGREILAEIRNPR